METHNLRLYLGTALKEAEIRRTCCAVEAILRAGTILDELSPTCLEQVRDYCSDYNRGRKGSFSEFKHAYIDMVVEHLNDARLRERRLFSAITGQEKDDLRDKW
jgi:hypothetical protein